MDIRFDDRVVLVSGAAQGIGRAMAQAFLQAGARVHLADVDPAVTQTGTEMGAAAHVLDLSDLAASAALIQGIAEREGRVGPDRVDFFGGRAAAEPDRLACLHRGQARRDGADEAALGGPRWAWHHGQFGRTRAHSHQSCDEPAMGKLRR